MAVIHIVYLEIIPVYPKPFIFCGMGASKNSILHFRYLPVETYTILIVVFFIKNGIKMAEMLET